MLTILIASAKFFAFKGGNKRKLSEQEVKKHDTGTVCDCRVGSLFVPSTSCKFSMPTELT